MASKLAAAKIAAWSGVRAVIAAADSPSVVVDAARREAGRHRRSPREERLPEPQAVDRVRAARRSVVVDDGARRALTRDGRSLLPPACVASRARSRPTTPSRSSARTANRSPRAWRALRRRAARVAGRRTADLPRAYRTRWSTATTSSSSRDLRPSRTTFPQGALARARASVTLRPARRHLSHDPRRRPTGEGPLGASNGRRGAGEVGRTPPEADCATAAPRRAGAPPPPQFATLHRAQRPRTRPRGQGFTRAMSERPTTDEVGARSPSPAAPRRPGARVDRRPRTPPCSPRPTCSSSGRPRSSPPTPPTSSGRGRRHGAGAARPAAPHRGAHLGHGRRLCATSPPCPDPVGEVLDGWTPPNGLEIQRVPGAARASWRSSTRTGPTSRATPPACA